MMFPYRNINVSKTPRNVIKLVTLMSIMSLPNIAQAHNFCALQDSSGDIAWDIEDNGNKTIPFDLTAGDAWSSIEQVTSASIRGKHQYTGDMAAELRSPSGTNVVLFRLGDGRYGEGFSYCGNADFDITFSDTHSGDDLSVSSEGGYCTGSNDRSGEGVWPQPYLPNFPNVGSSPAINATVKTYNSEGMSSNLLSNFEGDEPLGGSWGLYVEDAFDQDVGTVEEACVDMDFASVTYDMWVSADATCSDTNDTATFQAGNTVHVCYIASNEATQDFELQSETNNHGQNLTELAGSYSAKFGGSSTIRTAVRTFTAGESTLPVGTTQLDGDITIEGTDTFFKAGETLTTSEMVTITVLPANADLSITKTNTPGVNSNVDQAADTLTSGASTSYTLVVTNNGPDSVTGPVVTDTPTSGLTCTGTDPVTLAGDGLPVGSFTIADLTGGGITLDTLADGQSTTLTYSCEVN